MKFIFPQNYKFSNKLFGVIDYNTAIINVVLYVFVYLLLSIFIKNIKIKIFIFIAICFPFFLISILGINNENIFLLLKYVFKYLKNRKIYLYK